MGRTSKISPSTIGDSSCRHLTLRGSGRSKAAGAKFQVACRRTTPTLAGHQHHPRGEKEMKEIVETREVTQQTYCRAETDRTFYNASQLTGGVNNLFSFRNVTPLDRQTVVRMNKDTLYTVALVDTSKGATITVPEMPAGRYFSVTSWTGTGRRWTALIVTPGALRKASCRPPTRSGR